MTTEINPMYADLYAKLDAIEQKGVWRITYNGRILGDDRGYSSEVAARIEIDHRIEVDHHDARRHDRPVLLSKVS
jgi:hypothetical protein